MIDQFLQQYTSQLSVLYVEDDPVGGAIIQKLLDKLFGRVYGAVDGADGLRQFHQQQPDLIITDLMMPVLDGIGMLQEVRKSNQKIPVLLMTASLEHVHLVEAINLGVSKFLAKPLRLDAVQRALLGVVRELHLERVAEQARKQEVELLQYRNRYHSRQQELARDKERHIVHNQLADCFLPTAAEYGGWLVDLVQQPRDIMSGDSYAVIKTVDNRLLLFLADAMGHGLSASVTSMLATAFFNHVARGCACSQLGFVHLVSTTMRFAADNLLEDEVFSGLVLELDPQRQLLRFASCGMPSLMVVRNGEVERIRGANPPVSAFSPSPQLQEINLEGVSDILLATDGLGDAGMRDGGSYREQLADDLLATATAAELFARYIQRCDDAQNDDDITALRLTAIGQGHALQQFCFSTGGTLTGVEHLQQQVMMQLTAAGATGEKLDSLELALGEALMNAFEHGCLGMGADKQRLMLEGEYDDLIMAAASQPEGEISLRLSVVRRAGGLQAWIELTDTGPGFDTVRLDGKTSVTATSGRGFMMMQRSVDLVRRSPAGNRLVLMQMFETA